MIFLDPETVIKRVAIGISAAIVTGLFGYGYWKHAQLKMQVAESQYMIKSLEKQLKDLMTITVDIRSDLSDKAKNLESGLIVNKTATLKVDSNVQEQTQTTKQLAAEQARFRSEIERQVNQLKQINAALQESLNARDAAHGKFATDTTGQIRTLQEQLKVKDREVNDTTAQLRSVQEQLRLKDREVSDLRSRLAKEEEWRNRQFYAR